MNNYRPNRLHRQALPLTEQADYLGVSVSKLKRDRMFRRLVRLVDSFAFNAVIAVLIVVSVCLIFLEFLVLPGLALERITFASDVITWIFVIELTLRFIAAPSRRIFFTNYWIDIISVLPLFRVFRCLRVFRLLRLLRLARVAIFFLRQLGRFSDHIERSIGQLTLLVFTAAMLIACGTLAMLSQTAHDPTQASLLEAFSEKIWLSTFLFVSGEPVGEIPPTLLGRVVAVLISVSGLVVFAVLVGTVTASMSAYLRTKMQEKDVSLDHLREHTIICGWDRLGCLILSELESMPSIWAQGVVIVAQTESDIASESGVKNSKRLFQVREDFTKMSVLKRAGAEHARSAIVLADKGDNLKDQDRDARTVLCALTLEKINPQIFTCAELLEEQNATHLRIAGVEEIISRASLTAGLFCASLANRGIGSVVTDLLTHRDGTYLRKIPLPKKLANLPFIEVFKVMKEDYNATLLAIEWRENGEIKHDVNPEGQRLMKEQDRLIIVTKADSAFRELLS